MRRKKASNASGREAEIEYRLNKSMSLELEKEHDLSTSNHLRTTKSLPKLHEISIGGRIPVFQCNEAIVLSIQKLPKPGHEARLRLSL